MLTGWISPTHPSAMSDSSRRIAISVVIPVKDDAVILTACLRALAAQTRHADEIIVVDNGSTDESAAVARAAGARVLSHHGGGIPAASAVGYDAARHDVIARLDADCVPAPTWLATIAESFAEYPDVDVLTGGARFIDGPVVLRRLLAAVYLGAYYLSTMPLLGHPAVFGSNTAMRRAAWLAVRSAVHRHDPDVHDDLDLAFHLGERHVIRYERRLRMGISMRPFASLSSLGVRAARGIHTVRVHYPDGVPPARWFERSPSLGSGLPAAAKRWI